MNAQEIKLAKLILETRLKALQEARIAYSILNGERSAQIIQPLIDDCIAAMRLADEDSETLNQASLESENAALKREISEQAEIIAKQQKMLEDLSK